MMTSTTLTKTNENKPKPFGRPTKLTPERQAKIVDCISKGNYLITACQAVGIDKSTYLRWLECAEREGENGGGIYHDFSLAIKKAEASAETARVARIEAAGTGGQLYKTTTYTKKDGTEVVEEVRTQPQWLADMTHLERRHPDRWSKQERPLIQIDASKIINIDTIEIIKDYGNKVIEGESKEIEEGKSNE